MAAMAAWPTHAHLDKWPQKTSRRLPTDVLNDKGRYHALNRKCWKCSTSPSSAHIGGGTPQILADAGFGRGGTWNQDRVILFSTSGPLLRIRATGGTPEVVTHLERGQGSQCFPQFLPDGNHDLFSYAFVREDPELLCLTRLHCKTRLHGLYSGKEKPMRISRKLVATLGLMIGLVTVGAPVRALGAPIAVVSEGPPTTISDAFTIMNPNAFAVTLTLLSADVNGSNSDPSDFLMGATVAGGTCVPLLGVNGGFAANAACTVSLSVMPTADIPENEPVDFGLSGVTLTYRINNGALMSQMVTVQVNDVPEPGSATMVGLGIVVLLGAAWAATRRFRFLSIAAKGTPAR
jgi:hypothetical protein